MKYGINSLSHCQGWQFAKKCQLNVKMGSKSKTTKNTSNLWTHLKIHHSSIFEEAKKKRDAEEENTSSHIQASLPMMFDNQTKWKTSDVQLKKSRQADYRNDCYRQSAFQLC